jgi:hypothetical protein
MPSRVRPKAQLSLVLDRPRASPLPVLPEGVVATLADLLLEASASHTVNPAEESGDEQQDQR